MRSKSYIRFVEESSNPIFLSENYFRHAQHVLSYHLIKPLMLNDFLIEEKKYIFLYWVSQQFSEKG